MVAYESPICTGNQLPSIRNVPVETWQEPGEPVAFSKQLNATSQLTHRVSQPLKWQLLAPSACSFCYTTRRRRLTGHLQPPQCRLISSSTQELLLVNVKREQDISCPLEELSTTCLKSVFIREVQSTYCLLKTKIHSIS